MVTAEGGFQVLLKDMLALVQVCDDLLLSKNILLYSNR